jgi:hypothetical protein
MTEKSLVVELQALAQARTTDIVDLLRAAKVVAVKLQLDEFDKWIEHEMQGYGPKEEVPSYREVQTELRLKDPFLGLVPVVLRNAGPIYEHFLVMKMRDPIAKVAHLLSPGRRDLTAAVTSDEMKALERCGADFLDLEVLRLLDKSSVAKSLEAVRDNVLRWSLDLERHGILGEGMTFTKEEKQAAASSSTTINNYGSMVQGDHAAVASAHHSPGARVHATGQQQAQINDLVELRKLVEVLLAETRKAAPRMACAEVLEHVEDLAEEVQKAQPKPSRLKAAFGAIKTGLPLLIEHAPKAVETIEKIKHWFV